MSIRYVTAWSSIGVRVVSILSGGMTVLSLSCIGECTRRTSGCSLTRSCDGGLYVISRCTRKAISVGDLAGLTFIGSTRSGYIRKHAGIVPPGYTLTWSWRSRAGMKIITWVTVGGFRTWSYPSRSCTRFSFSSYWVSPILFWSCSQTCVAWYHRRLLKDTRRSVYTVCNPSADSSITPTITRHTGNAISSHRIVISGIT